MIMQLKFYLISCNLTYITLNFQEKYYISQFVENAGKAVESF